jgi:hypothetical protein
MTEKKKNIRAICQGEMPLGKAKLPCYVLEDKTRVLTQTGAVQALGLHRFAQLPKFVATNTLAPFISKETMDLLNNPIKFTPLHGGKAAYGFKATVLVGICDAVLQARKEGKLKETQLHFADQCEMLTRSLAKTGIIALIDEATGYEKIRETGELIKFFKETMVREIASDRVKEFERRGVFDGLYKIYNLPRKKDKPWQHPQFFGSFFIKYVYKPLDSIITDGQAKTGGIMLRLLKEKKNLNRGALLYQFIAEVGEPQFFEHLTSISNLMKIADNKKQFDTLFDKVFGNIIQDDLFPEPEILKMFEPEKPSLEGQTENDKIINSIRADFPLLNTEGFENTLKKASFKKAKK